MTTTARTAGTISTLAYGTLTTPIGPLALAWREDERATLVAVHMARAERPGRWDTTYRTGGPLAHLRAALERRLGRSRLERRDHGAPLDALAGYFEGETSAVDALTVDTGGTALQGAIWAALRNVPPGTTETYGELAARVGRPRACRAAGRAVATNPIPIVVPCHRIVGRDGSLTGFGGGLERKRWLLRHEGALSLPLTEAR